MARVSTYVNCMGNTEEAFEAYAAAFGTTIETRIRFADVGMADQLPPEDHHKMMHIVVPILAGHLLMGTDMLASQGHTATPGNNTSINLEPDSREEADRLYAALSEGATEDSGMADMPWGAYWGSWRDRFGIRWMINVPNS